MCFVVADARVPVRFEGSPDLLAPRRPLPAAVRVRDTARRLAPMPRRARRLGLRARSTVATGLAALIVSLTLSSVAYLLVRSYLLTQRDKDTKVRTITNANLVQTNLGLTGPPPKINNLLLGIPKTEQDGFVGLYLDTWYSPRTGANLESLPQGTREAIVQGRTGRQRFTLIGKPYLVMTVALPAVKATYVEVYNNSSLQKTLDKLGNSLVFGSAIATLGGAALGAWSSRRVLLPLGRVSLAASDLAAGGLDTRLPEEIDPDLDRLVVAFNSMADAVQARIERETRFASDVSHELRTPLAAVLNSAEVLERRRDELPERSRQALDVLLRKIQRFERTTQDLLELSRMDAGGDHSMLDAVMLPDVIRRIAHQHGCGDVPIATSGRSLQMPLMLDKRRLERIVGNLLDNARVHGDGAVGIDLTRDGKLVTIVVDDAGPGVPSTDRSKIFERFSRGVGSSQRPGSGLGLALVAEHASRLSGSVQVDDRPGGGARFTVSFLADIAS